MNKLQTAAWATLSTATQGPIQASRLAPDPTTLALGPPRTLPIGEIIFWSKFHTLKFTAEVLAKLNPGGCSAFSGSIDRRVSWLKDEAKKVNSSFNIFSSESLDSYLKCDAFVKHQPLLKKPKKNLSSTGEFSLASLKC
jgi:hypothetical protein